MCYVGKATKIFIFIVTVLVVLGLVLGFGLLRHSLQNSHKCSGDSCHSPSSPVLFPNPNPNSNPSPNPLNPGSSQPNPPSPELGSPTPPSPPSPNPSSNPPNPPSPVATTPPATPPPPIVNPSPPPTMLTSEPPPPPPQQQVIITGAPPPGSPSNLVLVSPDGQKSCERKKWRILRRVTKAYKSKVLCKCEGENPIQFISVWTGKEKNFRDRR
ncbi:proline-rich receptor-like protein kinase PERK2 [Melia azedarach]|uniref:Proline-rich receptor-like protein kinase PERK2 n=1 Tax=Melia azedarach TaxID=155640 RepID=A0ACC1Z3Y3_MELAZ|nr:proline-rich receptor-like protein kinase PERK2 [Melia azedarach]